MRIWRRLRLEGKLTVHGRRRDEVFFFFRERFWSVDERMWVGAFSCESRTATVVSVGRELSMEYGEEIRDVDLIYLDIHPCEGD